MKAAAVIIGGFLLLAFGFFGVIATLFTSVPLATDEQRALYDQVVKDSFLDIPGQVLLAVDTVRFHQDFSHVTRETVQQTADVFSVCARFTPIYQPHLGRDLSIAFHVPREGTVGYGVSDASPGVTAQLTASQGRTYPTLAVLPAGDYTVSAEGQDDSARYVLRLYLWLKPCGQAEISAVLDQLGLQGDDRAMVYHLIAIYFPEEASYGRVAPGPYDWPLDQSWPITSRFGERLDPVTGGWSFHTGVDTGAPAGTPVHPAEDGEATFAGWDGNYGNAVRISDGNGVTTVYGHLQTVLVTVGQRVARGQAIGLVGSTGKSTGPHLHFEWRIGSTPVDPLEVYHWKGDTGP